MKTVQAVFENGVFRPTCDVDLPERTEVELELRIVAENPDDTTHQNRVYAILSESFETDDPDLAARHNEHQP
jgi:predicted DNA-binding antitoxin AbrB/MazE fold protein